MKQSPDKKKKAVFPPGSIKKKTKIISYDREGREKPCFGRAATPRPEGKQARPGSL